MTTRETTQEWLDELQIACQGDGTFDEEAKLIGGLIAHLDRVGWPEAPHDCGTCDGKKVVLSDFRGDEQDWCDRHGRSCKTLGHTCGAWKRRET